MNKAQQEKEALLSQKHLKELLHYNELTGLFRWLQRPVKMFSHCKWPERQCNIWNVQFSGKIAGHKYRPKNRNSSYIRITITLNGKQKPYRAHRLAFLYMTGAFPVGMVDHPDGDGTDNIWEHIRDVTVQENLKNQSIYSNNTSGHTGVFWNKQRNKYIASIGVNGKSISGGSFNNKADAIAKRQEMNLEHGFHINHGRQVHD